MAVKTRPFDAAAYLDSDAAIAAYLTEALDTSDANIIADALGAVARARGMSEVARSAGLSRESLYRALSADGNPELGTVLRVLNAFNIRLTAVSRPARPPRRAGRPSRQMRGAEIDRIRAMTPRKVKTSSTDLARQDRDRQ